MLLELNLMNSLDEIPIAKDIFGLLSIISVGIFGYLRIRNKNKLNKIKSLPAKDRIKEIQMTLIGFGVTVDTEKLNPDQTLILLKDLLRAKTIKYLIFGVVFLIAFALISAIVYKNKTNPDTVRTTILVEIKTIAQNIKNEIPRISFESEFSEINNRIKDSLEKDGFLYSDTNPSLKFKLYSSPPDTPRHNPGSINGFYYYYEPVQIKLSLNGGTPFPIGIEIPKTDEKSSREAAKAEFSFNCNLVVNEQFDKIYNAVTQKIL